MSKHVTTNMKTFRLANLYVRKRIGMKRSNGYMDHVMNGFLDSDRIHLNRLGYHLVTRQILVALSESLYRH